MSTPYNSHETLAQQSEPVSSEDSESQEKVRALGQIAGGMFQPFAVRNFRLLFGGQIISTIGDALYAVALPWLILNNGGSAQELGIVLAAYGIPRVGSVLVGGWLSDRLRPWRLMLLADTARALLVGILAALALWGHPSLWQLCAIGIPLGAFAGTFATPSMAILPDILSDERLQAGNALSFSSTQAANLVGSAIAGVIVAVLSAGTALAADALTFVVSAVSLAMMRVAGRAPSGQAPSIENPEDTVGEEQTSISFGRFLRTSRLIQVILLITLAANFCFGGLMEVALPALVHGPLHGGASSYGLILAAFGAGAFAGGILAGMLGRLKRKGLIALLVSLLTAASIALVPYGGVPGAAVWMLLGGIFNSITNVFLLTVIQLIIPRHLMGRVMGLLMFTSLGTYPISVVLGGVLSNQFGPAILFPLSGLLVGLVMLVGIAQQELREL